MVKSVSFRSEGLTAISNVADKGALSLMNFSMSLQILSFGEPLPAPRKFAVEGLGAVVKVHVVNQTYFSLKSLATAQICTLEDLLWFLTVTSVLSSHCLKVKALLRANSYVLFCLHLH